MKRRIDPYFVFAALGAAVVVAFVGARAGWYQDRTPMRNGELDSASVLNEVRSSSLAWSVGRADAPISVVEMVDLGCPGCEASHVANWSYLRTQAESGRVLYTVFPMPLPSHPNAIEAALVAHCVGRQETEGYWNANAVFFANQQRWSDAYPVLDLLVETVVTHLNQNEIAVSGCVRELGVSYRASIMSSRLRLVMLGVTRTPFILVNGQPVAAESLQSHLESLSGVAR